MVIVYKGKAAFIGGGGDRASPRPRNFRQKKRRGIIPTPAAVHGGGRSAKGGQKILSWLVMGYKIILEYILQINIKNNGVNNLLE